MKKHFKILTSSLLLIFFLSILTGCSKDNKVTEPISRTELMMGTVVSVSLYDSSDEKILDKVFDKVK